MAFLSELLTYLFKFIVLGVITIAGVMCGAKMKKNKLAKNATTKETDTEQ